MKAEKSLLSLLSSILDLWIGCKNLKIASLSDAMLAECIRKTSTTASFSQIYTYILGSGTGALLLTSPNKIWIHEILHHKTIAIPLFKNVCHKDNTDHKPYLVVSIFSVSSVHRVKQFPLSDTACSLSWNQNLRCFYICHKQSSWKLHERR